MQMNGDAEEAERKRAICRGGRVVGDGTRGGSEMRQEGGGCLGDCMSYGEVESELLTERALQIDRFGDDYKYIPNT